MNQDSLLEMVAWATLPTKAVVKKAKGYFWAGVQTASFAALAVVAGRGMWVERTLAKELSTIRAKLEDDEQERRDFLEGRKKTLDRP